MYQLIFVSFFTYLFTVCTVSFLYTVIEVLAARQQPRVGAAKQNSRISLHMMSDQDGKTDISSPSDQKQTRTSTQPTANIGEIDLLEKLGQGTLQSLEVQKHTSKLVQQVQDAHVPERVKRNFQKEFLDFITDDIENDCTVEYVNHLIDFEARFKQAFLPVGVVKFAIGNDLQTYYFYLPNDTERRKLTDEFNELYPHVAGRDVSDILDVYQETGSPTIQVFDNGWVYNDESQALTVTNSQGAHIFRAKTNNNETTITCSNHKNFRLYVRGTTLREIATSQRHLLTSHCTERTELLNELSPMHIYRKTYCENINPIPIPVYIFELYLNNGNNLGKYIDSDYARILAGHKPVMNHILMQNSDGSQAWYLPFNTVVWKSLETTKAGFTFQLIKPTIRERWRTFQHHYLSDGQFSKIVKKAISLPYKMTQLTFAFFSGIYAFCVSLIFKFSITAATRAFLDKFESFWTNTKFYANKYRKVIFFSLGVLVLILIITAIVSVYNRIIKREVEKKRVTTHSASKKMMILIHDLLDFLENLSKYGELNNINELKMSPKIFNIARLVVSSGKLGNDIMGMVSTFNETITEAEEKRFLHLQNVYNFRKMNPAKLNQNVTEHTLRDKVKALWNRPTPKKIDYLHEYNFQHFSKMPHTGAEFEYKGEKYVLIETDTPQNFGKLKNQRNEDLLYFRAIVNKKVEFVIFSEELAHVLSNNRIELFKKQFEIPKNPIHPPVITHNFDTDLEILGHLESELVKRGFVEENKHTIYIAALIIRLLTKLIFGFAVGYFVTKGFIYMLLKTFSTQDVRWSTFGSLTRKQEELVEVDEHSRKDFAKYAKDVRDVLDKYSNVPNVEFVSIVDKLMDQDKVSLVRTLVDKRVDRLVERDKKLLDAGRKSEMMYPFDNEYYAEREFDKEKARKVIFGKIIDQMYPTVYEDGGEDDDGQPLGDIPIQDANVDKIYRAKPLSYNQQMSQAEKHIIDKERRTKEYAHQYTSDGKQEVIDSVTRNREEKKERRAAVVAQKSISEKRDYIFKHYAKVLGYNIPSYEILPNDRAIIEADVQADIQKNGGLNKLFDIVIAEQKKQKDETPTIQFKAPTVAKNTNNNAAVSVSLDKTTLTGRKIEKIVEQKIRELKATQLPMAECIQKAEVKDAKNVAATTSTQRALHSILADLQSYQSIIFGNGAFYQVTAPKNARDIQTMKIFVTNVIQALQADVDADIVVLAGKQWVKIGDVKQNFLANDALESEVHKFIESYNDVTHSLFGITFTNDQFFEAMKQGDNWETYLKQQVITHAQGINEKVDHQKLVFLHVQGVTLVEEEKSEVVTREVDGWVTGYLLKSSDSTLNFITCFHAFAPYPWPTITAKVSFVGTVVASSKAFTNPITISHSNFQMDRLGKDTVAIKSNHKIGSLPEDEVIIPQTIEGPISVYAYHNVNTRKGVDWRIVIGKVHMNSKQEILPAYIDLQQGDSGSLLFDFNHRIIGTWVGIVGGTGAVSRLNPAMFDRWPLYKTVVTQMNAVYIETATEKDIDPIRHLLNDRFVVLGKIHRHMSGKQKLHEIDSDHELYQKLESLGIENSEDFHITSTAFTLERNIKDMSKWLLPQNFNPNAKVLQRAQHVYDVKYVQPLRPYFVDCTIATFDEFADFLSKNENGLKSPGEGFVNKWTTKIDCFRDNRDYFRDIYEGFFVRKDRKFADLQTIFRVCNKEELLSTEKFIIKEKVRTFMAADIVVFMIMWCLFKNFHEIFNKIPFKSKRSSVGCSEFYGGWDEFIQFLLERTTVWTSDVSKYDGSVTQKITQIAALPVIKLCPFYDDYTFLIQEVFYCCYGTVTISTVWGLILLIRNLVASGVLTTLLFNTLIMVFTTIYSWCWFVEFSHEDYKEDDVYDFVNDLNCGDDKVQSHDVEAYKPKYYEDAMKSLNFTCVITVCEKLSQIHYLAKTPIKLQRKTGEPYYVFEISKERLKKMLYVTKTQGKWNRFALYTQKVAAVKPYAAWDFKFWQLLDKYQRFVNFYVATTYEHQMTDEERHMVHTTPIWSIEESQAMYFPQFHTSHTFFEQLQQASTLQPNGRRYTLHFLSGEQNFNTAFKDNDMNAIINRIASFYREGEYVGAGWSNGVEQASVDVEAIPNDESYHQGGQSRVPKNYRDEGARQHDNEYARSKEPKEEWIADEKYAKYLWQDKSLWSKLMSLGFSAKKYFGITTKEYNKMLKDKIDIVINDKPTQTRSKFREHFNTHNKQYQNLQQLDKMKNVKNNSARPKTSKAGKSKTAANRGKPKTHGPQTQKQRPRPKNSKIASFAKEAKALIASNKGPKRRSERYSERGPKRTRNSAPNGRSGYHFNITMVKGKPGVRFRARIGGTENFTNEALDETTFNEGQVLFVIPVCNQPAPNLNDPFTVDSQHKAIMLSFPKPVRDYMSMFDQMKFGKTGVTINVTTPSMSQDNGSKMFLCYVPNVNDLPDFTSEGRELLESLQLTTKRNYIEFPLSSSGPHTLEAKFVHKLPGTGDDDWLTTGPLADSPTQSDRLAKIRGVFIGGFASKGKLGLQQAQIDVILQSSVEAMNGRPRDPITTTVMQKNIVSATSAGYTSFFKTNVNLMATWTKSARNYTTMWKSFTATTVVSGVTFYTGDMYLDLSQVCGDTEMAIITMSVTRVGGSVAREIQLFVVTESPNSLIAQNKNLIPATNASGSTSVAVSPSYVPHPIVFAYKSTSTDDTDTTNYLITISVSIVPYTYSENAYQPVNQEVQQNIRTMENLQISMLQRDVMLLKSQLGKQEAGTLVPLDLDDFMNETYSEFLKSEKIQTIVEDFAEANDCSYTKSFVTYASKQAESNILLKNQSFDFKTWGIKHKDDFERRFEDFYENSDEFSDL